MARSIFRRWRTLLVLSGILAFIWLAPAIVALTPLKQTILNAIFADLKGTTRVSGASLSWLSPVVLENLELIDGEGRTLFSIPKARSSASLISLLTNHRDLGTFTFERPSVHVVWDETQTNFETTLAA